MWIQPVSSDEVDAYCKDLVEKAGAGGGSILTSGCGIDHAKVENARAMMEAAKEYGVYRQGCP